MTIPAEAALERLREGNDRFVANVRSADAFVSHTRRAELTEGQEPFAIILGCADSRVPAEIVFDQGLGDLFVIRVAGNIVAPSQVGSVEFAAARFDTKLVVVLGHTQCGAIHATIEALEAPGEQRSSGLAAIVDRVRPSVEWLLSSPFARDHDALVNEAVRANIHASVEQLRRGSKILEELIANGGLRVVGAEYSLETGVVTFFEDARPPVAARPVFLGTSELLFRAKLQAVVIMHGGQVTRDAAQARLAVIELGSNGWEAQVVAFVKRGVPVLAFGAHVKADQLRKARDMGAEAVPNSEAEHRLAALLE